MQRKIRGFSPWSAARLGGLLGLVLISILLPWSSGLADQPLAVTIAPAEQEAGTDVIRFTLTNTLPYTIDVLRWNTPLEGSFNAAFFEVTHKGEKVRYIGRQVKRGDPSAAEYVALGPGESASATISLSAGYAIHEIGIYEVTFSSYIRYSIRDPANKSTPLQDLIRSAPLTLEIKTLPDQALYRMDAPAYTGCSITQTGILDSALAHANIYAAKATDTLETTALLARATAARYGTWFGAYLDERYATVAAHFSSMQAAFANATVDFRCDCTQSYIAFVYANEPYVIHICSPFWDLPMAGTDSQAGVIIHEMSHFTVVAGTSDYVYGQENAKALAISTPDNAIHNADNHEYFAENTPYLPMSQVVTPHDLFADAPAASSLPVYAIGTSSGAGKELNEPYHAGNSGGASVWLHWTAPWTATVTASTVGSSFDTLLAVYTGSTVSSLNLVAANDDADIATSLVQSRVSFTAMAGQTYRIAVDGFGGVSGSVYLALTSWAGDVDHDGSVNLTDILLVLRILSGLPVDSPIFADADVNGDNRIGAAEAVFILNRIAEQ